MKKTLFMLSLVVVMLGLGMSQAYAVLPTVDGTFNATEWDNVNFPNATAYPYYLDVLDPNEADNAFDNTDISRAVVLQELSSISGDLDTTNDGIYILLQVYAPPPTLDYQSIGVGGIAISGIPNITMQGDLTGDGLNDLFNVFIRHYNTVADQTAGNDVDRVEVCVGSQFSCLSQPLGSWTDFATATGGLGVYGRGIGVTGAFEYFIPSGTLGTPTNTPFPSSFVGQLTYDNGLGGPNTADDVVIGQLLIPEPSTIMLTVTGLLGMLGFGKFKFWN